MYATGARLAGKIFYGGVNYLPAITFYGYILSPSVANHERTKTMRFSQAQFNAVVATAKKKAAGSPRWIRAIGRAASVILSFW